MKVDIKGDFIPGDCFKGNFKYQADSLGELKEFAITGMPNLLNIAFKDVCKHIAEDDRMEEDEKIAMISLIGLSIQDECVSKITKMVNRYIGIIQDGEEEEEYGNWTSCKTDLPKKSKKGK